MTKIPFFIMTAVLSIALLSSCASDGSEQQSDLTQAPDFEVTTIEGKTISLQQSLDDGKPLVVYFTASWCPTCARNWPVLSELYPEYEDRLTIVSISIDPTDDHAVMTKLAEDEGFTFPSTVGHPEIMLDFGVSSQATTVGVNREGYIEFMKSGVALNKSEYTELFESLLAN